MIEKRYLGTRTKTTLLVIYFLYSTINVSHKKVPYLFLTIDQIVGIPLRTKIHTDFPILRSFVRNRNAVDLEAHDH